MPVSVRKCMETLKVLITVIAGVKLLINIT